jgi:hypothetical protein
MRGVIIARLVAVVLAAGLSGCEKFFPDLEGPLGTGSWIHHMPVRKAVDQIQCELSDFIYHNHELLAERAVRIKSDNTAANISMPHVNAHGGQSCKGLDKLVFLSGDKVDPESKTKKCAATDPVYADVQLFLQQDTMGNVTYIGIDLNKLGLEPLAQLISLSNKAPSLSISGQANATVKSQLDFQVPQKDLHHGSSINNYDFGQPCAGGSGSMLQGGRNLVTSLGLRPHLENFFKRYKEDAKNPNSHVCMNKLTLQTQFAILVDAKAGLNPLGETYILPISGLNVEIQPKFTHSLQISLYLEPEDHRVCPNPKPSVAPNPKI